jgi:hypothetical protein
MSVTQGSRMKRRRIEEFQKVFADAMTYMKVRLIVTTGPQHMAKAHLKVGTESHACEIDADGPWKSRGPVEKAA